MNSLVRPKSSIIKFQNKTLYQANRERIHSSNGKNKLHPKRSFFSNTYQNKRKKQIKNIQMYDELWEYNPSNSDEENDDEDYYGISQLLKINSKPKKIDHISTNTRKGSALTYFDLGYKSKRALKNLNNNRCFNLYFSTNYFGNNRKHKKIPTKIFSELYNDNNRINNIIKDKIVNTEDSKWSSNQMMYKSTRNYSANLTSTSDNNRQITDTECFKGPSLDDNEIKKEIGNNHDIIPPNIRTEYLFKSSKFIEILKKFNHYTDYFRIEKREFYSFSLTSLINSFNSYSNYLLNDIKSGVILNSTKWNQLLLFYFNLSHNLLKYQRHIFSEFSYLRDENINLRQRLSAREEELTTKNKDIELVNEYILKYDLNTKVKYGKKKEITINELKQKYNSQMSSYIITIHKLKDEIKELTRVLNENKINLNNFEEVKNKLKDVGEKFEKEKKSLENQNDRKDVEIKIISNTNEDLIEKIRNLEIEIKNIKEEDDKIKIKNFEYKANIEYLKNQLEEKNKEFEILKEKINSTEIKEGENKILDPIESVFYSIDGKLKKKRIKDS